jgi:hypothetical protein
MEDGVIDVSKSRSAKHSSAKDNHMTPRPFTNAAGATMGSIDVDPATTEFANIAIGAKTIYTAEDSGLDKPWHGRVWLNPPGGALRIAERGTKSRAVSWWLKLVEEYEAKRTEQAIFLAFSLEFLQAVQKIKGGCKDTQWPLRYCACFVESRIPFELEADVLAEELREERMAIISSEAILSALSAPDRARLDKIERRIKECEANAGGRVAGDQPTHGNVIIYMPPEGDPALGAARFAHHFREFGRIHNPWNNEMALDVVRKRIERAAVSHEEQAQKDGIPKKFVCVDLVKADALRRFGEVFVQ